MPPRAAYRQYISGWKSTRGADVVIELPPVQAEQVKYVYYSAYHSKRLVNGYSGYTPPLWAELEGKVHDSRSIAFLQGLGVDGVLLHSANLPSEWRTRWRQGAYSEIKLIKRIGEDYFFSISEAPGKI